MPEDDTVPRLDHWDVANTLSGAVFSILILPVCVYITVLFYQNRKLPMLKSRVPTLMTVFACGCISFLVWLQLVLMFHHGGDFPCLATAIQVFFHLCFLSLIYVTRCVLLVFKFEITRKLAEHNDNKETDLRSLFEGRGGWFVRHRSWVKPKNLLKVGIVFGALYLAVPLVISIGQDFVCYQAVINDVSRYVLIVHVLLILMCYLKLRQHGSDAFDTKEEFFHVAIIAVVAVIAQLLNNGFLDLAELRIKTFTFNFFVLIAFARAVAWPLYRALVEVDHSRQIEGTKNINNLEELLDTELGFDSFMSYLKREFASENLLFWDAVRKYRKRYRASLKYAKCVRDMVSIYRTYVEDDATYQVNLGFQSRHRVKEAVENATRDFEEREAAKKGGHKLTRTRTKTQIDKEDREKAAQPHASPAPHATTPTTTTTTVSTSSPKRSSTGDTTKSQPDSTTSVLWKTNILKPIVEKDSHSQSTPPRLSPIHAGEDEQSHFNFGAGQPSPAANKEPEKSAMKRTSEKKVGGVKFEDDDTVAEASGSAGSDSATSATSTSSSALGPTSSSSALGTPQPTDGGLRQPLLASMSEESSDPSAQGVSQIAMTQLSGGSPKRQLDVVIPDPDKGTEIVPTPGIGTPTAVANVGGVLIHSSPAHANSAAAQTSSSTFSSSSTVPSGAVAVTMPGSPGRPTIGGPSSSPSAGTSRLTMSSSNSNVVGGSPGKKDGNRKLARQDTRREEDDKDDDHEVEDESNLTPTQELAKIFDEPQEEIYRLIERDSLSRYLQSPEFARFKEEFNDLNHSRATVAKSTVALGVYNVPGANSIKRG